MQHPTDSQEPPTYVGSEEADPVAVSQAVDDDGEEGLVVLVCDAYQLCTVCHAGLQC